MTRRVFNITLGSFFMINILSLLGTVIDGFAIGNHMDSASISAAALISPVIIVFSIISVTSGTSIQVVGLKTLTRGDLETAGRALTATLSGGIALSAVFAAAVLLNAEQLVALLARQAVQAVEGPCADYLMGMAIGMPAITAMNILTRTTHMEGDRKTIVLSVAVMTAFNIIGDMLCVTVLDTGLFGVGLDTSLSYYAGTAVLARRLLKGKTLIKPRREGIALREILKHNLVGVSAGITSAIAGLTLAMKIDILNSAVIDYAGKSSGLEAYNVQIQVNYIVNAFLSGAVSTMFLLGCLYTAEEDRGGFKSIIRNVAIYVVAVTVVLSAVIFVFASPITLLYLEGGTDASVNAAKILRAYAVGLTFQMMIMMFANYVQIFDHMIIPNVLYLLGDVASTLAAVRLGTAAAKASGADMVNSIFYGIAAGQMLIVLILPLFIILINRRLIRSREDLLMMPDGFGVRPGDELAASIRTQEEVMSFSQKTWDFCVKKGESQRIAYLASLAVEEMATNVIKHGFSRDNRSLKNILNARIVSKEGDLIIRLRDNTLSFNPKEKVEAVYINEDRSRMIGLRMIMAAASEVIYTSMFNLNNLIIRINKEPQKKEVSAELE